MTMKLSFLVLCLFLPLCLAANVTYDRRSLIIDGQRKLLISASIHYPRSVPAMWPSLIQNAKEGGVDVIETYVFWNGHELSPDNYHFDGRFDLVKFINIVHDAGLYLILRMGPFVAAEWNFGGVPVWLHYIPNTVFRTDNASFKKFTTYIVSLMKRRSFCFAGGPIILKSLWRRRKPYAMWAAQMAVSQNIGVPWIMCQQYDAPDPVVRVPFNDNFFRLFNWLIHPLI
ncbi:hypothetical protein IC575_024983 [Cucumis melo]